MEIASETRLIFIKSTDLPKGNSNHIQMTSISISMVGIRGM